MKKYYTKASDLTINLLYHYRMLMLVILCHHWDKVFVS